MEKNVEQIGRGVRITRPVDIVTLTLDDYLQQRYLRTREDLSSRAKMLIGRVEKYIEALGGRQPQSIPEITTLQGNFLQTVLGILSSPSADALMCWDVLLFLANKNAENLFNIKKASQHYHTLPTERQIPFLNLMTLVVETANIRNRATFLKNSVIANYTAILKDDIQRTNLAAYYAANI